MGCLLPCRPRTRICNFPDFVRLSRTLTRHESAAVSLTRTNPYPPQAIRGTPQPKNKYPGSELDLVWNSTTTYGESLSPMT